MKDLFASQRFQRLSIQFAFVLVIVVVFATLVIVGRTNIQAQGIATGFGFLERTTGWPLSFAPIEVGPRSTYARVLFAGLLNTLLVGLLTLVFATLLGLILALFRVSNNTLMRLTGTAYVEVFRNIPVILQVFFWYALLTHLPGVRGAMSLGDVVFLSNRGLNLPAPALTGTGWLMLALGFAVIAIALFVTRSSDKPRWRWAGVAFLLLVVGVLIVARQPDVPFISIPQAKGLRFVGGITLKPEFNALLIGLVLFGASYIGEIIRGGLLSVDKGRMEAAAALGLKPQQINRLVRIPLAFRAMLPALTNQYVWLMKGTTIGIAIGYPDYFAVISTSINQAGNTLELMALLMLGFLAINYSLGFAMNRLNDRLKLKGGS